MRKLSVFILFSIFALFIDQATFASQKQDAGQASCPIKAAAEQLAAAPAEPIHAPVVPPIALSEKDLTKQAKAIKEFVQKIEGLLLRNQLHAQNRDQDNLIIDLPQLADQIDRLRELNVQMADEYNKKMIAIRTEIEKNCEADKLLTEEVERHIDELNELIAPKKAHRSSYLDSVAYRKDIKQQINTVAKSFDVLVNKKEYPQKALEFLHNKAQEMVDKAKAELIRTKQKRSLELTEQERIAHDQKYLAKAKNLVEQINKQLHAIDPDYAHIEKLIAKLEAYYIKDLAEDCRLKVKKQKEEYLTKNLVADMAILLKLRKEADDKNTQALEIKINKNFKFLFAHFKTEPQSVKPLLNAILPNMNEVLQFDLQELKRGSTKKQNKILERNKWLTPFLKVAQCADRPLYDSFKKIQQKFEKLKNSPVK